MNDPREIHPYVAHASNYASAYELFPTVHARNLKQGVPRILARFSQAANTDDPQALTSDRFMIGGDPTELATR